MIFAVPDSPRDLLDYLDWWEHTLQRATHQLRPSAEWPADRSLNEIAIIGIEPPTITPDDTVMNVDLAIELHWPGTPPIPDTKAPCSPPPPSPHPPNSATPTPSPACRPSPPS